MVGVSCIAESLLVHSSDFQSHVVLHERDDLAHFEYSLGRNVSTLKSCLQLRKAMKKLLKNAGDDRK